MDEQSTLLLSIRPQYADAIFRGEKLFELRRRRPRMQPGDRVIVYSSSPRKALVGCFTSPRIVACSLPDLWDVVGSSAGVTKTEFDQYFDGLSSGVAIAISAPVPLKNPIPLSGLRRLWPHFQPPQSFLYLPDRLLDCLPRTARTLLV
jgi:predicted transcriptional regulator